MTNETKISKTKNKKYTPNMDLLDSYSDITEHVPAPMVALFEFDDKKLVYCGTAHDNDISVKTINKCFEDFDIDCVVTEYDKSATLTIPYDMTALQNELEYAALCGMRKGIDVVLADTGDKDWLQDMVNISRENAKKMQLFFMLNDAHKYKRHFGENFSIERALKNTVYKYWNNDLPTPMTKEEFQEYFMEQFGFEITDNNISDIYEQHPEWYAPDKNGSLINKIWADINTYSRDPHMVKCIFEAVNSHKCVLATFGAGHFDDHRRILEYAFGKPTFIYIKA